MKPDEIARYLKDNPQFFEDYADLLSQVTIPHPHGGRAIPLAERQTLALREKNRQLEAKLRELVEFGEENDTIGEKVHRLSVTLLGASGLESALDALYRALREDFAVPCVALRMWRDAPGPARPEREPLDEAWRAYAAGLGAPACGTPAGVDPAKLFGEEAARLRSFACVPLRDAAGIFGLLVMASEDAQRFNADMGTLYLQRLGELAAASLARHLA